MTTPSSSPARPWWATSPWARAARYGSTPSSGKGCNVQDCCVLHSEKHATVLGNYVSVGHGAIVHGAVVGDNTIVGMGATLLDFAKIGKNCMVGGGSVVTGKMDAPDGSLILGNPAKVVRPLTEAEIAALRHNAEHYAELKERYR